MSSTPAPHPAPASAPAAPAPRPARRRRTLRTALIVLLVILALVVGLGVLAVQTVGPRFGIYLFPPSVKSYSATALDVLDQGYYATGPEWEQARADVVAAADGADDYADIHDELAAAAEIAGGKHSRFMTPEESRESADSATADFAAPTVTTANGIITITIPELGGVSEELQQQYAQTAADGIAQAAPQTCGWIVDLRGNRGGTMYPMLSGLAPLLPDGEAFTMQTREGEPMALTIQADGAGMGSTLVSVGEQPKITGQPIAVLQDDMTASSGEAIATSFRGLDQVESFGTPSAGYTSANIVVPLYDGATIVLTTSMYVDRDGVNLQEQPIQPDHPTDADAAADGAAAWISEQGCTG